MIGAASFMAVSPTALRSWLAKAKPGELFTYATGVHVDRQHQTVVLVRQMTEDGLVCPHHRPGPDGTGREHLVRRRDKGEGASAVLARQRVAMPERDTPLGECLAMLTRSANFTRPCPTNADIARALGLRNDDAARYLLRQLVEMRLIEVEDRGSRVTRVVTILSGNSAGRRTSQALTRVGKGFGG